MTNVSTERNTTTWTVVEISIAARINKRHINKNMLDSIQKAAASAANITKELIRVSVNIDNDVDRRSRMLQETTDEAVVSIYFSPEVSDDELTKFETNAIVNEYGIQTLLTSVSSVSSSTIAVSKITVTTTVDAPATLPSIAEAEVHTENDEGVKGSIVATVSVLAAALALASVGVAVWMYHKQPSKNIQGNFGRVNMAEVTVVASANRRLRFGPLGVNVGAPKQRPKTNPIALKRKGKVWMAETKPLFAGSSGNAKLGSRFSAKDLSTKSLDFRVV